MSATTVKWWQALNPAIYLISILPAIAVLILAGDRLVWIEGLWLSTIAVVLLQHAINLFNDVSDWKLGADKEKTDSWVRIHDNQTKPVLFHGVVSFIAGSLLGLWILLISGKLWILYVAAPLILLGYLYNAGERPLSYTRMGEWVTGICYGGVFGCLWLVAGLEPDLKALAGTLSFAALATSLLLSHQPPQIETDRAAGKLSFAVRYGRDKTINTSVLLFLMSGLFIGVGIYSVDINAFLLSVFVLLSLSFTVYLSKIGVNPKRVLLAASCVLISGQLLKYF